MNFVTEASAPTLDAVFRERVRLSPDAVAYKEFDERQGAWRDYTWAQIAHEVARWQAAFVREGLKPGDRVALMLKNCTAWVIFDQAALGLGLVVVPLYTMDRPDNAAYIVNDAGAKLLLFEHPAQWDAFAGVRAQLEGLQRILCLKPLNGAPGDPRLTTVAEWLPVTAGSLAGAGNDPDRLATIIYTSGTTGRPKGVMLSHRNIVSNCFDAIKDTDTATSDLLLSFLPLSHVFERTVGYYQTVIMGCTVAYCRSIPQLVEDLATVRPTVLISVPRIYERVYAGIKASLEQGSALKRRLFWYTVRVGWGRFERAQGRGRWRPSHLFWPLLERLVARKALARLGGRLRVALTGGAALAPEISRVFIGLGLPLVQGYGLTETSPVVCTNHIVDNDPASVGKPIAGVSVRLDEQGALWVKGAGVMQGYWNKPEATDAVKSRDGWLNTGDIARIDEHGRIHITGRLKEIIVTSTGEKVPPVDMEAAIARDPLFEQVMVIGEGRSYLAALAVINAEQWKKAAAAHGLQDAWPEALSTPAAERLFLERIGRQIAEFPGYAKVLRAALLSQPFTIENGLLTPTLKLRRAQVLERYRAEIDRLYAGHDPEGARVSIPRDVF